MPKASAEASHAAAGLPEKKSGQNLESGFCPLRRKASGETFYDYFFR
jgi:hypothetical protein